MDIMHVCNLRNITDASSRSLALILFLQIPGLPREEAFATAQRMLNEEYIKCITSRSKVFKDGYVFYTVVKYVRLPAACTRRRTCRTPMHIVQMFIHFIHGYINDEMANICMICVRYPLLCALYSSVDPIFRNQPVLVLLKTATQGCTAIDS